MRAFLICTIKGRHSISVSKAITGHSNHGIKTKTDNKDNIKEIDMSKGNKYPLLKNEKTEMKCAPGKCGNGM